MKKNIKEKKQRIENMRTKEYIYSKQFNRREEIFKDKKNKISE